MLTITVVIPNFNHGHLIEDSVLSTFEQSVPPDEIIIVDDGSTDDSIPRIRKLEEKIPSVRLIPLSKNQGAIRAGNLGAKEAKSEIIFFRSADDLLLQGSISFAQQAFRQTPQAHLAFGEILFFQNEIESGTKETLALSNETKFFSPSELLDIWLPDFNLPEPACFVRKSSLMALGGLKEEAKWYSGWLCFTSIALALGLAFIPKPITAFRLSPDSYGTSNLRNTEVQRPVLRFLIREVMNYDEGLRQKFIDSGAFGIFGSQLQELIEKEADSLPKNSQLLLDKSHSDSHLHQLPRHGIPGVITRRLEEMQNVPSFMEAVRTSKILVYGAGSQTSFLLRIWKSLGLPRISGIIVTERKGLEKFEGFHVQNLESVSECKTTMIVLSSKSFEAEMSSNLDEKLPSAKKLSFWIKQFTKL